MNEQASRAIAGAAETFGGEWDNFRAGLLSKASPVVVSEMRRAFYCGAFALLQMMCALSAADPDDERAADFLESIFDEVTAELESSHWIKTVEPGATEKQEEPHALRAER